MHTAGLRLLLIRHGFTDWNESGRLLGRTDVGLNARGRTQAETLARAIAALPVAALWSSPQRRTRETAEPIAAALGVAVEVDAALDEVWLAAGWQGKTFAELADDPDLQRYVTDPMHVCDAIEPCADVARRVVDLVERLGREHAGQMIALVSHGDPLRLLIAHHLGLPGGVFRRLVVLPGSVSGLALGGRGPRMLALNWLPGEGMLGELLT